MRGGARSARATAPSMPALAPRYRGLIRQRLSRNCRRSGRPNAASTRVLAASDILPPTGTPPIVTPGAMTTGLRAASGAATPRHGYCDEHDGEQAFHAVKRYARRRETFFFRRRLYDSFTQSRVRYSQNARPA